MSELDTRGMSGVDAERIVEETENLISTYDVNAEWIRFADAKAGVVLTINGIFASFLIPTLHDLVSGGHGWLVLTAYVLFGLWAVAAALSCLAAFRCILPHRPKGRHPSVGQAVHFHSAAAAARFSPDDAEEFMTSFQALGGEGFKREVLLALLVDAHIANAKYRHVTRSLRALVAVAVVGFGYLLILQFATALR